MTLYLRTDFKCILVVWLENINFCPCVERLKTQWKNLLQIPSQRYMCITHIVCTWACVFDGDQNSGRRLGIISVHLLALILCTGLICWLEIVITWWCTVPLLCMWRASKALLNPGELWFYHKLTWNPIWSFHKILAVQYLWFINVSIYTQAVSLFL